MQPRCKPHKVFEAFRFPVAEAPAHLLWQPGELACEPQAERHTAQTVRDDVLLRRTLHCVCVGPLPPHPHNNPRLVAAVHHRTLTVKTTRHAVSQGCVFVCPQLYCRLRRHNIKTEGLQCRHAARGIGTEAFMRGRTTAGNGVEPQCLTGPVVDEVSTFPQNTIKACGAPRSAQIVMQSSGPSLRQRTQRVSPDAHHTFGNSSASRARVA
ncbi:hypothetical protein ECC02_011918 [Trypanosoma cruzi]|uniref:Uncharacterized protein n=1 Tax=Trypanosoma cruzi TaxID=5693 RepID=A0A7J6XLS7_TRYCR|nr:hypothetical protein ECC02_011918 [Trypanosoma cruzi]